MSLRQSIVQSLGKATVATAFVVTTAAIVFIQSGYPQSVIKEKVETELSKNLGWNVEVDSVSGSLLRGVTISGVKLSNHDLFKENTLLKVDEAQLRYNPLKAIGGGDLVAATQWIKIKGLRVDVIRDERDLWNILMLIPKKASKPKQISKPKSKFIGNIDISDATVTYRDEIGWRKGHPLERPFVERFNIHTAKVSFEKDENINLNVDGEVNLSGRPFIASGNFTTEGRYDIRFQTRLPLEKWGPYAFPNPEYKLASDNAKVAGRIISKYPFPNRKEIPFWYRVNIHTQKADLKLPFYEETAHNIESHIEINHGWIEKEDLTDAAKRLKKKNANDIWQMLHQTGILENGRLVNRIENEDSLNAIDPNYKKAKKRLLKTLEKAPVHLTFHGFDGNLSGIPIFGTGKMRLDKSDLTFNLFSDAFDMASIKRLYPVLSNWNMSGETFGEVRVAVKNKRSKITGSLQSPQFNYYGLDAKNGLFTFTNQNKQFCLDQVKADLYSSRLLGKGCINFSSKTPALAMAFSGQNFDASKISKNSPLSGLFDLSFKMNGPVDNYDLDIVVTGNKLAIIEQYIDRLNGQFQVKDNQNIHSKSFFAVLNQSKKPLNLTASIDQLKTATINMVADDISIYDVSGKSPTKDVGKMTINADIKANLTPQFFKSMLDEVTATTSIRIQNYPFYNRRYKTVALDAVFDKHHIDIQKLLAKNSQSALQLDGQIDTLKPKNLRIKIDSVHSENLPFIANLIPEKLAPMSGQIHSSLTIKEEKNKPQKNQSAMTHYFVSGDINLENVQIKNQDLDTVNSQFVWANNRLSFTDLLIQQNDSEIRASGHIDSEKNYDITLEKGSQIHARDIKLLTGPIGELEGHFAMSGYIKSGPNRPEVDLNMALKNVETNTIKLDEVNGRVYYKSDQLTLDALDFRSGEGVYQADGLIDISPIYEDSQKTWKNSPYDIKLKIDKADLANLNTMISGLYQELRYFSKENKRNSNTRKRSVARKQRSQVYRTRHSRPLNSKTLLYNAGSNIDILSHFNKIEDQQNRLKTPEDLGIEREVLGQLSGVIKAKSRPNKSPLIDADIRIKDAQISVLRSEEFHLNMKSKKDRLDLKMAIEEGTLGAAPFQSFKAKGYYDDTGYLNLNQSAITSQKRSNTKLLTGRFPISAYWNDRDENKHVDLTLKLNKDDIQVLTVLNKHIGSISNKGEVTLKLTGPIQDAILSASKIDLDQLEVKLGANSAFRTPFKITSKKLTVKNNHIRFPKTRLEWAVSEGSDNINKLDVLGNIKLSGLNLLSPKAIILDMNLTVDPTKLNLNLANRFNGKLRLGNTQIAGPLAIALSQAEKERLNETIASEQELGPTIKSAVRLEEANITLPSFSKKDPGPTWLLDLEMHIDKNVAVVGGFLGKGVLPGLASSVDFEFQPEKPPLKITGSLNAPIIENALYFTEGSIVFLNRAFDLLSPFDQEIFYKDSQYKVHENSLSFQNEVDKTGKRRLLPVGHFTALSIIERGQVSTTNALENPYDGVLVTLNGPVFDLSNLVFEKYSMSQADPRSGSLDFESRYQLGNASDNTNRNTYEIVRILLPELSDDTLAENNDTDQTNRLINSLGENQINTLLRRRVLRPLEKEIAKNVGLYDLRVDYNVGRAVLNNSSSSTTSTTGTDEKVGINMVQQLVKNKLFLRVKTDLDLRSENTTDKENVEISEIELKYKILRNLALTFSNVKEENQEQSRPKFSLKYSHEF